MALKKKAPTSLKAPSVSKPAVKSAPKAPALPTPKTKAPAPAPVLPNKPTPPKPPAKPTPPKVQELVNRAQAQKTEESGGKTNAKKKAPQPASPQRVVQRAAGAVTEAPKPVVPARQPANTQESGRSVAGEEREYKPEIREAVGQITLQEMKSMSYTAQHDLWRRLNEYVPSNTFVTVLKPSDIPKVATALKEAIASKLVPEKKPVKDAYYCPYCVGWMKYRSWSWTGSDKCVGCGISINEFYVRKENDLFKLK